MVISGTLRAGRGPPWRLAGPFHQQPKFTGDSNPLGKMAPGEYSEATLPRTASYIVASHDPG